MKKINITMLFLLGILPLFAQQAPKTLGLREVLQTAETNYPLIRAKQLLTKASQASLNEARLEYMPALKLHGQLTYATANSLAGTYFPYGVVVPISGAINATNNASPVYGSIGLAYFEWAPFTFGQFRARVNVAKAGLATANADLENEKFQNDTRVAEAYFNFLTYYKLRITEERNLDRALAIQRVVRATVLSGLKPGVDSSFVNSEVSKARLSMMDAQRNENTQQEVLADLIGTSNQNFLPDSVFLQNIPALSAAGGINEQQHPLLRLYQTEEQLSAANESYISHSYLPKISILGAYWGRGSGISPVKASENDYSLAGGTDLTRTNYAVGLACTFNIADFPRINAASKAEGFRTQAYKAETEGLKQELQNQDALADKNLNLAILQAKEAPVQLQAANAAYTQKLTMYHNGLANIADLAQVFYNLNRAETDAAISNNAAWKALLYKAGVEGNMNILMNQVK